MVFRNIGYAQLIQMIYRNQSTIRIQRWWRSIMLKRAIQRKFLDEYEIALR
jgi:hypothetical protein